VSDARGMRFGVVKRTDAQTRTQLAAAVGVGRLSDRTWFRRRPLAPTSSYRYVALAAELYPHQRLRQSPHRLRTACQSLPGATRANSSGGLHPKSMYGGVYKLICTASMAYVLFERTSSRL
jgi:hypothetical protein